MLAVACCTRANLGDVIWDGELCFEVDLNQLCAWLVRSLSRSLSRLNRRYGYEWPPLGYGPESNQGHHADIPCDGAGPGDLISTCHGHGHGHGIRVNLGGLNQRSEVSQMKCARTQTCVQRFSILSPGPGWLHA